MRRPTLNSLLLAGALLSPSAGAQPAGPVSLVIELSCRPEAAPGRVLCELKYHAPSGARLVWVDALVTRAPDFVRPLRSRLGPERFGSAGTGERRLSLAFVASQNGVGLVSVRARGVVCRGSGRAERCHPESHDVQAEIRVGS
jgi:hypothetical protein